MAKYNTNIAKYNTNIVKIVVFWRVCRICHVISHIIHCIWLCLPCSNVFLCCKPLSGERGDFLKWQSKKAHPTYFIETALFQMCPLSISLISIDSCFSHLEKTFIGPSSVYKAPKCLSINDISSI